MIKIHSKTINTQYLYSFKIKTIGNSFFSLILFIAVVFLTVMIFVFAIGFYQHPKRFDLMYREVFLIIFIYVYLLDLFLWHFFGKDEILISSDKLLLRKSGKLFNTTRVILFRDILSIKYTFNRCSKFENIYLYKGGNIEFITKAKSFVIGQDISKAESLELIQNIRKILLEKGYKIVE